MSEEKIKKEILDYLDFLCLSIESFDNGNLNDYIEIINHKVEEYRKELENDYSLKLKR